MISKCLEIAKVEQKSFGGFFKGIFLPIFPHVLPMTHFAIFYVCNIVKLPLGSFKMFPASGLSAQ